VRRPSVSTGAGVSPTETFEIFPLPPCVAFRHWRRCSSRCVQLICLQMIWVGQTGENKDALKKSSLTLCSSSARGALCHTCGLLTAVYVLGLLHCAHRVFLSKNDFAALAAAGSIDKSSPADPKVKLFSFILFSEHNSVVADSQH
jgi:hypothetical protein